MNGMADTFDAAKEEARARLPEILAEVVPDFRPDKAFRCLSPDHEDRHPSMRYLSRANVVKCFACGWTGDVFKVVGAVYGLAGGDMFRKTYDLLGIDARGGRVRRRQQIKRRPANANPENWQEIVDLIFPPGWDVVEEAKLPLPLEVTAQAENGLAGRLAISSDAAAGCPECEFVGQHFDNAELGEFCDTVMGGNPARRLNPDFADRLAVQAVPAHMTRKVARFIIAEGQRRRLEAVFSRLYAHFQNGSPATDIFEELLNEAELIMGDRYDIPREDGRGLYARLATMFERFHANDDVRSIVADFRSTGRISEQREGVF